MKRQRREKLLKNSKGEYNYHFNWRSGGFNDVWAKNIKDFTRVVTNKFGSAVDVNWDTVRKVTPSEAAEMSKLGWMMTC